MRSQIIINKLIDLINNFRTRHRSFFYFVFVLFLTYNIILCLTVKIRRGPQNRISFIKEGIIIIIQTQGTPEDRTDVTQFWAGLDSISSTASTTLFEYSPEYKGGKIK